MLFYSQRLGVVEPCGMMPVFVEYFVRSQGMLYTAEYIKEGSSEVRIVEMYLGAHYLILKMEASCLCETFVDLHQDLVVSHLQYMEWSLCFYRLYIEYE
jgi:hypothetical protein